MKYLLSQEALIFFLITIFSSGIQSAENRKPTVHLRPYYRIVSLSEVEEVDNMVIRQKKDNHGFFVHSTIKHDYEVNTKKDDKVVIDHSTGLMWHQSGSHMNMSWKMAKKWVTELNEQGYAGFTDWRLPTLEEAVSLLESSQQNGNQFIDPVFDKKQWSIWTSDGNISDASLSLDSAWSVNFNHGLISWNYILVDRKKVRPVRLHTDD